MTEIVSPFKRTARPPNGLFSHTLLFHAEITSLTHVVIFLDLLDNLDDILIVQDVVPTDFLWLVFDRRSPHEGVLEFVDDRAGTGGETRQDGVETRQDGGEEQSADRVRTECM